MSVLKFYMKVFIVLLVVATGISSSCSKSLVNNYRGSIEGTWVLKQISGGFAGGTTAPDKTTTLTFEPSEEYSTTYNNQAADKGMYTVTKAMQPNYYYSDTLIKLFSNNNNDTLTYGMRFTKDSLFLDEGCCDRFSYTYVRRK